MARVSFPKGKSCLKPAWEPIILARKPGPMRELGIEECRVGWASDEDKAAAAAAIGYGKTADAAKSTSMLIGEGANKHGGQWAKDYVASLANSPGRWPANLVLDEEAGAMLDGQTGRSVSSGGLASPRGAVSTYGGGWQNNPERSNTGGLGDSGGASRFFYCAKASRSERESGLFTMSECETIRYSEKAQGPLPQQTPSKPVRQSNTHPTVKPLALMRWLVRLVAYPGDTVLDPFTGSGTTGVACAEEGREFVGIEREAEYIEIARRRIEAASAQERLPV